MRISEEEYDRFWEQLLNKWPRRIGYFRVGQKSHTNWLPVTAFQSRKSGQSGLQYGFIINKTDAKVEFRMYGGKDLSHNRYAYLLKYRSAIDDRFPKLEWCPSVKTVSIRAKASKIGLDNSDKWVEIQNHMIDDMSKLIEILQPYVKEMCLLDE